MSTPPANPEVPGAAPASGNAPAPPPAVAAPVPPDVKLRGRDHFDGLKEELAGEEAIDRRLGEIEMLGEEAAIGWKPTAHPPVAPEVRFLHVSRTIHQLVTDRNRSVGIFLAVASILVAAATGLLNVKAEVAPIIPLRTIQYWCLPATFLTLAVLAVFISFLLIRARIGLIYEVAKLNVLMGLPSKRVERVNPLSIFYIMHLLVVVLGGASAGLAAAMLAYGWAVAVDVDVPAGSPESLNPGEGGAEVALPLGIGIGLGLFYVVGLLGLYYLTILRNTTDAKLDAARS
ncbi:hypothetical protein [Planctomyces sp. SH-PL62]|uniref:hypothetical protein n=1 Tax=Planctomyces sp. SH-PL62 TaxID=1636152 RepID=UPI00078D1270|nr:hypothetical protein [Planctomyces sp. SH-PL62]AMV38894.1 hypothetical protein VT85_15775 [Planctomyces sp. SH-PL62]